MQAFHDLRVIEIAGSVAGAYAGKLFADYGATVLLVEPPGGSPLRREGEDWDGTGTLFGFNNTGKHSLALDLARSDDDAQLQRLLAGADVVIESSSPDPLTPVSETGDFPRLVRVYCSPFGRSGPRVAYRSTPLTDFALSGHMFLTGEPTREPLQGPPYQSEYAAGAQAFSGAMAALWAREGSGRGQVVELSLIEGLAHLHQYTTVMWTHGGHIQRRVGNGQPGPWHPNGHLPCRDGFVSINAPGRDRLVRVLAVMGLLELLEDPRFKEEHDLLEHRAEFDAAIAPWLETQTAQEATDQLQAMRVPAAPLQTMEQVLADEQLEARDFWRTVGEKQPLTFPRGPFRISDHSPELRPPPALGSAATEILDRFVAQPATPTDDVVPGTGPLDGLRILDLTQGWAGPLAGRILADLGADVIHVEPPWARGVREVPLEAAVATHFFPNNDPGSHPWNRSGIINKHNRNRRGLALRLDTPEGQRAVERIIARCDIVLENFTPRVMPGLGLDFERLRELNPRVVFVSMPGWGLTGPRQHYAALGPMVEAASGQCMLMGYRDSIPYRQGMAFPDAISGIHAPGAALVGLWDMAADPDHAPRRVENAQLETAVVFNGSALLDAQLRGREPTRMGNRHPRFAPQGVYPCAGDDRWIALTITNDAEWRELCAFGQLDPAWAGWAEAERRTHHDEIDTALAGWSEGRDHLELMAALQERGIIAGAALDAREMVEDPHLGARDFWVDVGHPEWGGAFPFAALPLRFSETPATYRIAGPALGEHNREVLREVAGLTDDEVDALEREGIIASEPPA